MKLYSKDILKSFAAIAMLCMVGAVLAEPVALSKVAVSEGNPTFGPFVNSSSHSSDLGIKSYNVEVDGVPLKVIVVDKKDKINKYSKSNIKLLIKNKIPKYKLEQLKQNYQKVNKIENNNKEKQKTACVPAFAGLVVVYLGETYVGEAALVMLSGLVMSGEYYLLNEINKYMDVEIPVTVKYGENIYNPQGFVYKTTYRITYRDLYYSLPKCPSFYYLVLMPIKNNKKVADTALTGAIGESVAVVVFENYYHYKVVPNWKQIWGGADFSITKGSSIWYPWNKWYKLEAKGSMGVGYISKMLKKGHNVNLKGGSGYVTCYCIPNEELYVAHYN